MSGAYLPRSFIGSAHAAPRLNDNRSIRRHTHRRLQIESKSATDRLRRWNAALSDRAPVYVTGCLAELSNRPGK